MSPHRISRLMCLVVVLGLLAVPERVIAAGVFSGVETPIVVKSGPQTDPHVSGRYTVFTDYSIPNPDVWYHDAADGSLHLVAGGIGDQLLADVSGSLIAYTDRASGAGDIHLYDIATGVDTNLTNDPFDQASPAVSSRVVAWEDSSSLVNRHIVVYDRATATRTVISGAGDQSAPAASEARVTYLDGGGVNGVKVYDATTGITSVVYPGPADRPAIDGTHVALTLFSLTDADTAVYDVAGNLLARLTLPGDQTSSHISGDWVAFEDFSQGAAHVGLWHWTGGEVYYPTPLTSRQQLNSISGQRVVYTDDRNGNLDIYAFDFTLAESTVNFSLSPISSITVSVGGSASSSVTITSVNSFNQAVTLSVSGSPSGVSTSFSPNPVTPPPGGSASSTLGLTLSPFVSPSTFTLAIVGTAGSLSHSISTTVTVVANPSAVSTVTGQLLTAGCIDNAGIANALTAKLAAAQSAITAGNLKTAINILSAFIHQVQAQSAKHILASCTVAGVTFDPAAVLTADARSIIDSLTVTATPNPITGSVMTATGSGIAGATLSLVDASGTTLATATTDVAGFYFFPTTGLLSAGGTYSVSVAGFPAGVTSSSPGVQMFNWTGSPISVSNFTISP